MFLCVFLSGSRVCGVGCENLACFSCKKNGFARFKILFVSCLGVTIHVNRRETEINALLISNTRKQLVGKDTLIGEKPMGFR